MKTKEKLSITITPAIRDAASAIAERKGMSLSTFIEGLLREVIEKDKAVAERRGGR